MKLPLALLSLAAVTAVAVIGWSVLAVVGLFLLIAGTLAAVATLTTDPLVVRTRR